MTQQEFEVLFFQQVKRCERLLLKKGAEYATGTDRFQNFKDGGEYLRCSPELTLLSYLTKHLISIRDLVKNIDKGNIPSMEVWEEKITDAMNYLFLLDAMYRRSEQ